MHGTESVRCKMLRIHMNQNISCEDDKYFRSQCRMFRLHKRHQICNSPKAIVRFGRRLSYMCVFGTELRHIGVLCLIAVTAAGVVNAAAAATLMLLNVNILLRQTVARSIRIRRVCLCATGKIVADANSMAVAAAKLFPNETVYHQNSFDSHCHKNIQRRSRYSLSCSTLLNCHLIRWENENIVNIIILFITSSTHTISSLLLWPRVFLFFPYELRPEIKSASKFEWEKTIVSNFVSRKEETLLIHHEDWILMQLKLNGLSCRPSYQSGKFMKVQLPQQNKYETPRIIK